MNEKDCKIRHSRNIYKIIAMGFIGIAFAVLFAFIFGYVIQLLWNWLMVDLFGLKTITYWQGFGIVILCKILFGGFGRHHPGRFHKKHCMTWGNHKDPSDSHFSRLRYFDEFWNDEGKRSFEEYIKRREDCE